MYEHLGLAPQVGQLVPVTAPGSEPVTRQEAKDWAKITWTTDDSMIDALISAARSQTEELSGRSILNQTFDYFLDGWPCNRYSEIVVPRPLLQTVTFLKYTDVNGVVQTLVSGTDYTIDSNRLPARIVPAYGKSFPSARSGIPNAIQLRFVAGYAVDVSTALGGPFKAEFIKFQDAIKVLVATMYKNREALRDNGELSEVPFAFWALINQHRVWWI